MPRDRLPSTPPADGLAAVEGWLAARGWQAFDFQREAWAAIARGDSGLLHANTGAGKTYAVWLGILAACHAPVQTPAPRTAPPLRVLWITPMRALAADTARALSAPLAELAPGWTLGLRTGDTSSSERARQDKRWPTALVTTPESLTLMLTRPQAPELLAGVTHVVVDEWHELLGSKRGVQVQLALARLRRFNPRLVAWGLSATLGNLEAAAQALCGPGGAPVQVRGRMDKALVVDTLLPEDPGRYSWAGHLGARMQEAVASEIERSGTTLVFTNVRSQAEIWYQLLLQARPEWAGQIALHHGSLDKSARDWVEAGLREGTLRAVVATSSLDLGVDFLPVERVLQVGSAKGVARMMQRAGRSGHAPGRASRLTLVPTHTMELVEAVAVREAIAAGRVESRESPDKPLDVLVQHLVTVALGGGFEAGALYEEVRGTAAYRGLTREEFDWALTFCERGGESLAAYPDYRRIVPDAQGRWHVPDRGVAQRHRMAVGTIVSDASLQVKYLTGGSLGTLEEGFIARLRPGDCFHFAGRLLEFVRVREMVAYVRKASAGKGAVPTWQGSRMSLSAELGDAVLQVLQRTAEAGVVGVAGVAGEAVDANSAPELAAALPMLRTQARLSRLPSTECVLAECLTSREGQHLFLHPFAGRQVHLGLASLLAWRLARDKPNTFSLSVNDYGLELVSAEPFDLAPLRDGSVFAEGDLLADVLASLNASELAQRRFREIARIAGLVSSGYPGQPKSARQLQASSGLFFEVFRKWDRGNLLLAQAEREVLSQELEVRRLAQTLARIHRLGLAWVDLAQPTPMSLPLMIERFRERLSTEQLSVRLERLLREIDRPAD